VQDPPAIAVLQSSISAMGGLSTWQSIKDWTIQGMASISGSNQSSSPFTWIGAGAEFRIETDTGSTTNLFLSGHGTPVRILNGSVSSINYHVARATLPFYLPAFVLQEELSNAKLTILYVGTTAVNEKPAVQVHVSDNSDSIGSLVTPHDWYFDPTSLLPLQVVFRTPSNENADTYLTFTLAFSQFQTVSGMQVPFQATLLRDSAPSKVFAVNTLVFNSGVPPSTFDPPQGGGQ